MNDLKGVDPAKGARDTMDWVYFYPGRLQSATDSTTYYDYTTVSARTSMFTRLLMLER